MIWVRIHLAQEGYLLFAQHGWLQDCPYFRVSEGDHVVLVLRPLLVLQDLLNDRSDVE